MLSNGSKFQENMHNMKSIMFSIIYKEYYTLQIMNGKDMHKKDSSSS